MGNNKTNEQPYNPVPYPGDTNGDLKRQSLPIDNLQNGQFNVVRVRTIGIDGKESKKSEPVRFRPLAQGTFVISPNHLAPDGGFNFEDEKSTNAYDSICDVYLYATGSKVGLSSPNRLTPGMRKSLFAKGKYEQEIQNNAINFKDDTIVISNGDIIVIRIKKGHAELKIENIDDHYPNISVRISYIYNPTIGIM